MSTITTVVIAGCGERGRFAYAPYSKANPDKMKIVGIADPNPERVNIMMNKYGVPPERCFTSAEEMFAQPKMADVAFICTQDREHVPHACAAIEKGYDILLEKPVSPDLSQCKYLLNFANKHKRHVTVCHVLRYSKFYQTIKKLIDQGAVGEIVNINAAENVGYWHQSHSFVRGNWRNSKETSPMILAKSCHDMDILLWLSGKDCKRISSFGGTYLFRKEKAPDGAAMRCMDGCECKEECLYDAEKIYLTDKATGFDHLNYCWLGNVLCEHPSREGIVQALKTGPYGRCVYHCDNDVVDHQQVNMEMEDGSTISFSMCAFSPNCYRTVQVMGTKGEINGDIGKERIVVSRFGQPIETIDLSVEETISGHGGGDNMLLESLFSIAHGNNNNSTSLTSLDKSIASHYAALAAEHSRLKQGESIEMKEFIERIAVAE